MSGSSDQLAEVYKQVKSYFQGHPVIAVQPTKGDPPDQYTITYNMTGFQQSPDGEIVESSKHVIELSIPFGFPHFPPSCKPKSEIFHPDFDPAAICLGDVWEQDSSLANIILYIGKMINGETFSSKNAFNDEAATWYKKNNSRFPLNAISWGGELSSRSVDSGSTIDTLGEDDFSTDFDYLTLDDNEDDTISQSTFPSVTDEEQEDLDLLQQLKFQKRFHELSRKLRTNAHTSEELATLKETADQEIQKCKSLYREAKNLENLGSAAKALKRFEVVQNTVADYPSIAADINRVKQTLELLSDLDPDQFDGPQPIQEIDKDGTEKTHSKKNGTEKDKTPKERRDRDSFFENSETRSKVFTVAMIALGVAAAGTIGLYYSYTDSILTQSRERFVQCEASLNAGQFKQAKQTCEDGKTLLDKVFIFHQTDSNAVRSDIDSILLSESLRNGLEGKILFDGMYLSKRQAGEFKTIKGMVALADNLFKMGKWEKASDQYTLLQEKSSLVKTFSPDLLSSIEYNKFYCQFQMAVESTEKFIKEEQWHLAVGSLTHTQSLLSGLPEDERNLYKEKLKGTLNRCKFEITLKNGDSAFNRGNWQDAIISYEGCLEIAQSYNAIKPSQIQKISNIIERSKLYLVIEQGNNAFAQGSWNEAIDAYAEASAKLASDQTLLDEAKLDINRKKLGKIILQASIVRDKQAVKSQLQNKELHEAGKLYTQILDSIEGSTYSSEEEFIKAKKEIHTTLKDLNQQIYISEKEAYLRENYQSLFVSNYPAAIRENLTNPVISYVKKVSGKLLFRMQCTEKRQRSRPLTLVMFYAYDKNSGQWELSTENQADG
ncbi:MAG: ubiquitin-protein ligase [Desulforhopalus sp.]|jgi:ubiquitin-protein ligase